MRLPVIMIIMSYLVLLLTDVYIWWDIRFYTRRTQEKREKAGKRHLSWEKIYIAFALIILAVLTVAICLPKRDVTGDITSVMWMLYLVTTVVISQFFYVIISFLGFIPLIIRHKRINTGLWVGLPVAFLVFCCMWWGTLVGRKEIKVENVKIVSPRLPKSFDGYKVAQISDLHVGTWGNDTTFLSRLVDSVNNLKPDLIVFTGDIVNRHSDELLPFEKVLSRLSAPDGVFSVLGNHDYGDYITWNRPEDKVTNLQKLKDIQMRMGWHLLDNTNETIRNESGDSIIIIGVGNWGEPPFSQYGDLNQAYPDSLNDGNFKMLLSHNPEHWNREVSRVSNIDLTLAGHTHAMQLILSLGSWKWSPSQYKYEQWGGLYERENNSGKSLVYVNIGAGEVGFPMRLGASPEITLFTFFN